MFLINKIPIRLYFILKWVISEDRSSSDQWRKFNCHGKVQNKIAILIGIYVTKWLPLWNMIWGHSITTWTRCGGRGSKNVCFYPRPGYKLSTQGVGHKMAKFCPRSCWMINGPFALQSSKFTATYNSSLQLVKLEH